MYLCSTYIHYMHTYMHVVRRLWFRLRAQEQLPFCCGLGVWKNLSIASQNRSYSDEVFVETVEESRFSLQTGHGQHDQALNSVPNSLGASGRINPAHFLITCTIKPHHHRQCQDVGTVWHPKQPVQFLAGCASLALLGPSQTCVTSAGGLGVVMPPLPLLDMEGG
jgi:hypothetical protein